MITNEQKTKIRNTITLLSSMVSSGENHTVKSSREIVETLELVNNLSQHIVIERFSYKQKVIWDNLEFWVMEDEGYEKVLVANADKVSHPEYNDWWVDRNKLNSL